MLNGNSLQNKLTIIIRMCSIFTYCSQKFHKIIQVYFAPYPLNISTPWQKIEVKLWNSMFSLACLANRFYVKLLSYINNKRKGKWVKLKPSKWQLCKGKPKEYEKLKAKSSYSKYKLNNQAWNKRSESKHDNQCHRQLNPHCVIKVIFLGIFHFCKKFMKNVRSLV